jgi:hypothetical protein
MTVQKALHERAGLSNAAVKGLLSAGGVRVNGRDVSASRSSPRRRRQDRRALGSRSQISRVPRSDAVAPASIDRARDDDVVSSTRRPGPDRAHPRTSRRVGRRASRAIYRRRGFQNANAAAVHRIDRYNTPGSSPSPQRRGRAPRCGASSPPTGRSAMYLPRVEGVIGNDPPARASLVENAKASRSPIARRRTKASARCRYRVIELFPMRRWSRVRLETGRAIRSAVQFAATGTNPLIGDVALRQGRACLLDRTAL